MNMSAYQKFKYSCNIIVGNKSFQNSSEKCVGTAATHISETYEKYRYAKWRMPIISECSLATESFILLLAAVK
jgi:hypothetical protein